MEEGGKEMGRNGEKWGEGKDEVHNTIKLVDLRAGVKAR